MDDPRFSEPGYLYNGKMDMNGKLDHSGDARALDFFLRVGL